MAKGYGLWLEQCTQAEALIPNLRLAAREGEQLEIENIMRIICATLTEGHRLVEDLEDDVYLSLRIHIRLTKLKDEMTKCLRSKDWNEGQDDDEDGPDRGGPPFKPVPVGGPSADSGALTHAAPTYTYNDGESPDGPGKSSDSNEGGVVKTAA